ncbi:hypothetical protein ACFQO7_04725 [Catellatospora aurea]|uniref:Uncharacterized protein n=1 Tax=Catellatospora aurea TaxID=1337874 RepID=A0ABW2GPF5_9ACTN
MIEYSPLRVRTADGKSATWRVEHDLAAQSPDAPWRLSLVGPEGVRFDAFGVDLYDCLKQIRRQTEPTGVLLCCNGARRNARPSGFYGSSLGAIAVYRHHRWRAAMPWDLVGIFGYAPPRKIATVEEQEAYLEKVDSFRRSMLPLLNPLQWITYGLSGLCHRMLDVRVRIRDARSFSKKNP